MTPAEIKKLTDQATRAKALLQRSAASGERTKVILDNYEKTLSAFEANADRISKADADLSAVLSAMGNAGPILEDAFQNDVSVVSVKPSETAHLPKVNGV